MFRDLGLMTWTFGLIAVLSGRAAADGPAVAPGGRGSTGPCGFSFLAAGMMPAHGGTTILYFTCSDGSARWHQGGGDGFGICAADDPLIPGGTLQAHPHAAGGVAVDCDEHLLAMTADSGHSGDAGDAHPDLEPAPIPVQLWASSSTSTPRIVDSGT